VLVVSALNKTTNHLESLADASFNKKPDMEEKYEAIASYHLQLAGEVCDDGPGALTRIQKILESLHTQCQEIPDVNFDRYYDQVVSMGELLSSTLISEFLTHAGIPHGWVDIRKSLKTDGYHREARVDLEQSEKLVVSQFDFSEHQLYLTQGFIAASSEGLTTTLGREGSDYTAALLGNFLNAREVSFWKDVEGIMNADPEWMTGVTMLKEITYHEAIELTYFGAKVIHPKTIKPLQNKNIPLHVRSFFNIHQTGTIIKSSQNGSATIPIYIKKVNQVLVSLQPRDYSFFIDESLDTIFGLFYKHKIKINLIQNSAISFTLCADFRADRFEELLEELAPEFIARYNLGLELITIRHYNQEAIEGIINAEKVLIEHRTRQTVHYVIKNQ
jgi:aspartate kinase